MHTWARQPEWVECRKDVTDRPEWFRVARAQISVEFVCRQQNFSVWVQNAEQARGDENDAEWPEWWVNGGGANRTRSLTWTPKPNRRRGQIIFKRMRIYIYLYCSIYEDILVINFIIKLYLQIFVSYRYVPFVRHSSLICNHRWVVRGSRCIPVVFRMVVCWAREHTRIHFTFIVCVIHGVAEKLCVARVQNGTTNQRDVWTVRLLARCEHCSYIQWTQQICQAQRVIFYCDRVLDEEENSYLTIDYVSYTHEWM